MYGMWLKTIESLAKARPVVVVGAPNNVRAPATDMPYGTFMQHVDGMDNVINLLGSTPIRVASALMSHAICAFTMDSGMLYVAQALRVPAVSVWGPVSPQSRIGYDHEYMELAVWNKQTCQYAGCHSFSKFPVEKCPRGEHTVVCEPIYAVTPDQLIAKAGRVESKLKSRI
jgi:ADP-heptose:LPS heptosyltransferase